MNNLLVSGLSVESRGVLLVVTALGVHSLAFLCLEAVLQTIPETVCNILRGLLSIGVELALVAHVVAGRVALLEAIVLLRVLLEVGVLPDVLGDGHGVVIPV